MNRSGLIVFLLLFSARVGLAQSGEGVAIAKSVNDSSSSESSLGLDSSAPTSNSSAITPVGEDTPLLEAARRGNLVAVKKLLDDGADIDSRDAQGATPLILALAKKDLELTKTLLDYGAATTTLASDGSSPLGVAARAGDVVGVKLLLDRGADAQLVDGNGLTPIMHAVIADDVVVTKLLLARGAQLRGTTRDGRSIGELVKPGGQVAVLPELPKQVDAAAVAASSSEIEDSSGSAVSSTDAAISYEPVPERARQTRVRLSTPVGQWKKRKQITLESVQVEARNVGEVAASDVKVSVMVPGGEVVTLEGPATLERNQSYTYLAKPAAVVTVTGNLKGVVSCSNCRK